MIVLPLHIEILGLTLSVVGRDEVLDDIGQVVLVGQLQSFGHVADNHLCTVYTRELFVRIDAARLVLGEIDGILCLTYIVIECSCTYQ